MISAGASSPSFCGGPIHCAASGPIIREIGRQEISCYCDCHEDFRFKIEFNHLRQIATVTENVCRRCVTEIRALDPNMTQQQYELFYGGFNLEHERTWHCHVRDGVSDSDSEIWVQTWQEIADFVDMDSVVEV